MGKSTEIDYNMMFELRCLDLRKKSVNQEEIQSVWVLLFLIGVIYPIIKSFLLNYHIFNLSMEIENKIKED